MATVQIRGIPDDVHGRLKSQAAAAGQSLNAFLLAQLAQIAATPTIPEMIARIRDLPPYEGPSSASVIREDRDSR